jgi:hypothetical protein
LTAKDRDIHDQGLVSVLKQMHDDLDAAVLEAYGWGDLKGSVGVPPASSSSQGGQDARAPLADLLAHGGPDAEALEQQLLTRLVALNHERAAEEKRGLIRWLRPDYQCGGDHRSPQQTEIEGVDDSSTETPAHRSTETPADWPSELPAQVAAINKLLPTIGQDPETLSACFGRKNKKRTDQITAILATLRALGHIV